MCRVVCSIALIFGACCAENATASVFDVVSSPRTFLGGPDSPVPDTGDFFSSPGFSNNLFTVGNLTNGCGLYLNEVGSVSRAGLDCVNPNNPRQVRNVRYDTGADTFTLIDPVEAQIQMIIKVGHPEPGNPYRDQDQQEEFMLRLVDDIGDRIDLAEFLDDVDRTNNGDEDDAYYRYVYPPAIIPAGTWHPEARAKKGSLEFLVRLNAVPEPAAFGLFATGLLGILLRRHH